MATAFGYEPVELKFGSRKVARRNLRSNLSTGLALIHGRGMTRHKPKAEDEHETLHLTMPEGPYERELCEFQCCAAL